MNEPQNGTDQPGPDTDAIKMFVGQVPRSMDENDLRKMFEEFGPVYQLNVLRDKVTNQSKGCCFVTFYTRKAALDAQNALHNIKTMPGMHHPVQMKPADSEKRTEERKLFIGMLSKKLNENDVKMMFAPYGNIEDCTVLRDANGQSKGCAFITYSNRQSALNCIKTMHHSQTMESCSAPLVVKLADTQKEKEQKKLQQMNANLWNMSFGGGGGGGGGGQNTGQGGGGGGMNNQLAPQYLSLLQQAAAAGNMGMFANLGNLGLNTLNLPQLLAALATASSNPGLLAALAQLGSGSNNSGANNCTSPGSSSSGVNHSNSSASPAGDATNNMHLQNLQGLAALANAANNPGALNALGMQNLAALNQLSGGGGGASNNTNPSGLPMKKNLDPVAMGEVSPPTSLSGSLSTSTNSLSGLAGLQNLGNNNMAATSMSPGVTNNMNGLNSGNPTMGMDALSQAYSGIQQYAASFPNAFNNQNAQSLQASSNSAAGKQTEGPDGANLFIYHLPQEFSDHDLMQTFMPFGNVVSAKVFIDKQTNLSKCFGFVSYDNQLSAQAAIQAMNGFQIGMKRLKVQLKRPKSENKPY